MGRSWGRTGVGPWCCRDSCSTVLESQRLDPEVPLGLGQLRRGEGMRVSRNAGSTGGGQGWIWFSPVERWGCPQGRTMQWPLAAWAFILQLQGAETCQKEDPEVQRGTQPGTAPSETLC